MAKRHKNKRPPRSLRGLPRFRGASGLGHLTGGGTESPRVEQNRGHAQNGVSGMWGVILPDAKKRWSIPGLEYVTPDYVEGLLTMAFSGESPAREYELYELMMSTWYRLAKNVNEVRNAVCSLQWLVQCAEGADDDIRHERLHALVEAARDGMRGNYRAGGLGWRATLETLLNGWFVGCSVAEIDWQVSKVGDAAGVIPQQTRRVSARNFGWRNSDGRFWLGHQQGEDLLDEMPDKFLVAIKNSGFGHACGGALLRPLAWFWCASNFSREWLMSFAELFGQPFRWATYDASQPGLKRDLEKMMESMGACGYGVAPDGTQMEYKDNSISGKDNPQMSLHDLADKACDLLVLGQQLTTQVGDSGSRALGEVQNGVRRDIIDAAAQWLAEVLNEQLVPAIARLNYGGDVDMSRLPWLQPEPKQDEDLRANAERIKIVMEAGIPLTKSWVYEKIGAPEPTEGDDVFGGVAATGGEVKNVEDRIYPKALALSTMIKNGMPVSQEFAYEFMGVPQPAEGEAVVTVEEAGSEGEEGANLNHILSKLPAEDRATVIAKLKL